MARSDKSSDSDSCDEIKRLKEAIDNDFIRDSMFSSKVHEGRPTGSSPPLHKDKKASSKECRISLRPTVNDRQHYSDLGLHVTPEFQQYVAKHLEKIIDSQLKEKTRKSKTKPQTHEEVKGGIKLLNDSNVYLSSIEETPVAGERTKKVKHKRKRILSTENSLSQLERCKEAAVSPDWVLMHEGTKGWAQSFKRNKLVINSKGDVIEEG